MLDPRCTHGDAVNVSQPLPLTRMAPVLPSPAAYALRRASCIRASLSTPLPSGGKSLTFDVCLRRLYSSSSKNRSRSPSAIIQNSLPFSRVCSGVSPDLGITEKDVLERAYDELFRLVSSEASEEEESPANVSSRPLALEETGGKSTTASSPIDGNSRRRRGGEEQEAGGRAPLRGREGPLGGLPGGSGADDSPGIPADDIIRLLREGAIDEHRRASPALSAACIYQEFAQGLKGAAKTSTKGRATDTDDRGGNRGGEAARCDDVREKGGGWVVSKEEFCDYFEAVTDLVDLNDLSLAPRACHGTGTKVEAQALAAPP